MTKYCSELMPGNPHIGQSFILKEKVREWENYKFVNLVIIE